MLKAANDNLAKFRDFHEANPHVYELIKQFAHRAIQAGRSNYGMQSVIERVRWHTNIETAGEPLKINNNHGPFYARMFMEEFPEHDGFFRTRVMGGRS